MYFMKMVPEELVLPAGRGIAGDCACELLWVDEGEGRNG